MSSAVPLHPAERPPQHPMLAVLVCPECRQRLLSDRDQLRCECGRRYPIVRGIPRFVADDGYVRSFSFEWDIHRRTQLDSARGDQKSMKEFRAKLGLDEGQLRGKLVLDAGVGVGRFTQVMTELGARVVGVDLSFAVEVAQENLGRRDDVLLAQGDIGRLPFGEGTFDYIVSIGVLHHTPDTRKYFEALVPLLKRGGTICIWVYPDEGPFKARNCWIPFTNKIPHRMFYEWCRWLLPFVQRRKGTRLQQLIACLFGYSQQPLGLENDILDTFDAFSPRYHGTHSPEEVARWFREAGLVDVRKTSGIHTSMRGTKP